MKERRSWAVVTELVRRAMPLVERTSWLVNLGQVTTGAERGLVERISILARRLVLIGVPSEVLMANCNCVPFRNCGAASFSGGTTRTETSSASASRVLWA